MASPAAAAAAGGAKGYVAHPDDVLCPPPVVVPKWSGFLFSSASPMLAAVFTNPFDVAKVRLQLQGELNASGQKLYSGMWDCIRQIAKHEGVRGLEKGLVTAFFREGSKNCFRIGLYDPVVKLLHTSKDDKGAPVWKRMTAGGISGAVGAIACNPFEILKTRMQASGKRATGHQHNYKGVCDGFAAIVRNEGIRGLYVGTGLSIWRSTLATAVNMTAFTMLKENLVQRYKLMSDGPLVDMSCALASAFATVVIITPIDTIRTRMYNQPVDPVTKRGLLYVNPADAFLKVTRSEGIGAVYKGFFPLFMRLGPHFTLTFVFLGQMTRMMREYQSGKAHSEYLHRMFNYFDVDGNGTIEVSELRAAIANAFGELKEALVQQEVNAIMANADKDHNGVLDFGEFCAVSEDLKKIIRRQKLRQLFNDMDRDGNGSLDLEELLLATEKSQAYHHRLQREGLGEDYRRKLRSDVERMFTFADEDKSGSISFEEFVKISEKLEDLKSERLVQTWMASAGIASE
ncbi:Tricarboxylate transport protein [Balamuthia mandrillaris]